LATRCRSSAVVSLQVAETVLELVEQRAGDPPAGRVCVGSEFVRQTAPQDGKLLGQAADLIFGVGEVNPQALFRDQRARGQSPDAFLSNLALAASGLGEAACQLAVGIQQRHGHPGAAGHCREADRFAGVDHGLEGLTRLSALGLGVLVP